MLSARISTRAFRTVLSRTRANARPITPTVRCISTAPTIEPKGELGEVPLSTLPDILQEPTHVNTLLTSTHYVLESIHSAGLPWWATIFCATFLLRTAITAPVAIYQQRAVGRMMELTPVLKAWLETLKTSVGVDHKLKGRDYATFNSEIQNAVRPLAFVSRAALYHKNCWRAILQKLTRNTRS